jgi:DNA-binding MarR family transcriptional regulator
MTHILDRFHEADALGTAFLGLQLHMLLSVIAEQGDDLLLAHGCRIRSRLASTLMLLKRLGPLTVTELGRHLGMSHQLVAHRVKALRELGLIVPKANPADRRSTRLHLTRSGVAEAGRLARVCEAAARAYRGVFKEIGCDLFDVVISARKALERHSLVERTERKR